jgi:DNA-binding NarL/FixJ family response regulator
MDQTLAFTQRQIEVVRAIAAGGSTEMIAARLGISPRTVRAHADTLRAKLGVTHRRQLPSAFREATGVDPLAMPKNPSDRRLRS